MEAELKLSGDIFEEIKKSISDVIEDKLETIDKETSSEIETLEDKLDGEKLESGPESAVKYDFSDAKGVDYEALFSYLTNTVLQSDYSGSYFAYNKPTGVEEENIFQPKFDMKTMYEVVRATKIAKTLGVEVYINPMKKEMFDSWKIGNDAENKMLWDLIVV